MPPEAVVLEPRSLQNSEKQFDDLTIVDPKEDLKQVPLGYNSIEKVCPHCKKAVNTSLRYHITDKTHCAVFILSILTWPCFACVISGLPYCLKWCQMVEHICPNCSGSIGKYSKF